MVGLGVEQLNTLTLYAPLDSGDEIQSTVQQIKKIALKIVLHEKLSF